MIMAQWSCDVPLEKWEDFLVFAKEKLRPFYESHGCRRYELFISMDSEKYFSYQFMQKNNRYVEQLFFDDIETFESFHKSVGTDSHALEMVGTYEKEFGVSSCSFVILREEV